MFASKSGRERRRDITRAAAGKGLHLRGMQLGAPVVDWGEAPDHVHSPGPNAANYERFRESAGASGIGQNSQVCFRYIQIVLVIIRCF